MSSFGNRFSWWTRVVAAVALAACASSAAAAPGAPALAFGDFDGDGTEDLVVARNGTVEIRRGMLAAYVPKWAGAKDLAAEPFRRSRPVPAPESDWIAPGDFDNDGRLDVALARRGARSVALMRGDGGGGLGAAESIELAGAIGAFASGDVDRPDGLRDLVFALAGDDGSATLVVFAGPRGAVRAAARTIALPWMPSHLAVGAFDGHVANDIAMAGGDRMGILQGRDRDFPDPRAGDEAISFEHVLGAPVRALAHGDLVADHDALDDLAVLDANGTLHTFAARADTIPPAQRGRRVAPLRLDASRILLGLGTIGTDARLIAGRFDASPTESLLLLEQDRAAIVRAGAEAKTHPAPAYATTPHAVARRGVDGRTELVALEHDRTRVAKALIAQLLTVNSSNDVADGACDTTHCSLRDAIVAANAAPAGVGVQIRFAIPAGAAIPTITPQQPLPVVTRSLSIDGTTQGAGFVEISGATVSQLPDANDGLVFEGAATVVRGLVVNRFDGYLVTIRGNGSIVEGNRIGTTASGAGNPDPNGDAFGGLLIDASGVRVGGTAGTTPLGGCTGACNLIGGVPGLGLVGTSAGDTLLVQGNHFGVAANGTSFLPTRSFAMRLSATSTVGGPTPTERNVFGASGYGGNTSSIVRFEQQLARTLFQGNFVGTDASGTVAGGGFDGVSNFGFDSSFGGTAGVTPGGACTGACNVFSGSLDEGIELEGSGERIVVQGNLFGLDRTGLAVLPNATSGLEVRDDDNLVGGTVPEAANVFGGNLQYGIRIATGGPNGPVRVVGNRIGTDASGTAFRANGLAGVIVPEWSSARCWAAGTGTGGTACPPGGGSTSARSGWRSAPPAWRGRC
jgi:CSLREA domain-containing protein